SKEEGELEANPSHLARNKRQVLYEQSKKEIPKSIDPVFTISQLMQGKIGHFIREQLLDEYGYRILLYTNEQLQDVVNMCCTDNKKFTSIFCLDVTFKLGPFFLLVTTYRNTKLIVSGKQYSPPMLGPLMILTSKDENTYKYFVSALIRRNSSMTNLLAYGTDSEVALINALQENFPKSVGFLHSIHQRRNLNDYMRGKRIPMTEAEAILNDVFGEPDGLIFQPTTEEFYECLHILEVCWKARTTTSDALEDFLIYFNRKKVPELLHKTSLKAVLEADRRQTIY
uniref:MULE transposase domain-containing protein n=1 Tax=Strigamia maritima TaxID=126957 RepID=T1JG07_STRMM